MDIPTETGAVKTTLYNLNVLNQLAMVEMKNKVLNETDTIFSDDLSENYQIEQVPIVGGFSYRPATRNERNHAHSKPFDL